MTNVATLPTATLSGQQLQLIRRTIANDCNDAEFDLFMAAARAAGLDPFRKQISPLVFNKKNSDKRRMSIITTIDGLRVIAARSGRYRPDEEEPDFTFDPEEKGPTNPLGLVKAKVRIFIDDKPVTGVAYWSEFAPISEEWKESEDGRRRPTGKMVLDTGCNWGRMPRVMLAKCFSPDTEVLTAAGFQRFSEVSAPIMQVTGSGLEPVHAIPFVQPYAGPMVSLDSDDLNFSVTPNHDMVTTAGKIEAGHMYEAARTRPAHFIPRIAPARALDAEISDGAIRLAAAYLADGFDSSRGGFRISVSRPRKVSALRSIDLHHSEAVKNDAGQTVSTPRREIVSTADKAAFSYKFTATEGLVSAGKVIDTSLLTTLSQRQARLFVDTLVEFDGHTQVSGVRRFYSSRPEHMAAFELAAVIGGYSVSNRKARTSDIATKANFYVTISDRDAIPVVRRGDGGTGLTLTPNTAGLVWCVTVPSGQIIVRRNGFSMVCGNCAEAQALRKAFPEDTSGLYEAAELDQARVLDVLPSEAVAVEDREQRLARIGGASGILFQLFPNAPLEAVPIGQAHDRLAERIRDMGDRQMLDWFESANRAPLQEFWARAPGDALEVKKLVERRRQELSA